MTLVIQTNIPGRIEAWLTDTRGHILDRNVQSGPHHQSERLLAMIDALLRRQHQTVDDLSGIAVVRGPGPFTAVRTGLVTANTLAEALHLPLTGLVAQHPLADAEVMRIAKKPKTYRPIRPWYGKEPNITRPKR